MFMSFLEKIPPNYFRDNADRHTPIPIEDENLFTALDDLSQDDTRYHRDPEPSRDIKILTSLGHIFKSTY